MSMIIGKLYGILTLVNTHNCSANIAARNEYPVTPEWHEGVLVNHKASATCKNGHRVEWGTRKGQVRKLFGGTKRCGMGRFEQFYGDGRTALISFDDDSWEAVRCMSCGAVFAATTCEECGIEVPVSAFKKKGFFAKLS